MKKGIQETVAKQEEMIDKMGKQMVELKNYSGSTSSSNLSR